MGILDKRREAAEQRTEQRAAAEAQAAETRRQLAASGELWEYGVVEIKESMIGDKFSGGKLQGLLNDWAGRGWKLKTMTKAAVKGRLGPGGVEGLLIVFERKARG